MKRAFFLVLFVLSTTSFSQSYSHLFELRGIEDSTGSTHLFYRYGLEPGPSITDCWSKSIYHFDLNTNYDTLFIEDVAYEDPFEGCSGISVFDYEFFYNNPSEYIYGGVDISVDPVAVLFRYDGQVDVNAFGFVKNIEMSNQTENLLYLTLNLGPSALLKSTDGGYNWVVDYDSLAYIDDAMISLSKNDDSQVYGIDQNKLVRSVDDGHSYEIMDDDAHWNVNAKLFYDADGQHIYGVTGNGNEYALFISNGSGNPFTWQLRLTDPQTITFTNDETTQGEIYYAVRKKIFKSTDFGTTFNLYRELDRDITGLYKKSGSNILYASTPLKIYEITPDTMNIIKELPVPDAVLNYYPLTVGNKWIYDYVIRPDDIGEEGSSGIYVREVLSDTTASNGKHYYKIFDQTLNYYGQVVFERVDSLTGKVYRYFGDPSLPDSEYVIHDLMAFVGDTVNSSRNQYQESLYTTVEQLTIFNKWGLTKQRKTYQEYSLSMLTYSLTQDVGLDSIYFIFDFGFGRTDLKGAIINGVVYGDTTVVSVENETPNLPTEFSLSQNYPNPFNPTTKIRYEIPGQAQNDNMLVTLKVYDVLGNEVTTLVNEVKPAGEYEVEFDGAGLPSGIYFYQIKAGAFIQSKKMILLK